MASAPVMGMVVTGSYTLSSGTPNPALGGRRVTIGNVGNLTADTFAVNFSPSGSARELPGAPVPLLDTQRTVTSGDQSTIFRSSSVMEVGESSDQGLVVRLTSRDDPTLQYPAAHPITGNPAGSPQGGNAFTEYVVAYSQSFPLSLVILFQQNWFASPCGALVTRLAPSTAVAPGLKIATGPAVFSSTWSFDPPAAFDGETISCPQIGAATQDPIAMDFALGQTVGAALSRGSSVVTGDLLGQPSPSDQKIGMRVRETLWGRPVPQDLIGIRYAHRGTRHRSQRRLSRSWDRVSFDSRVRRSRY